MIRPFAALRPTPEYAAQVAAPPYDVLSTEEARGEAQGKPWSFLHISKPEIDLPEGTDPYSPQVYAKAAETMRRMLWVIREEDRIARLTAAFDAMPALYIADGHHRSAAASRVAASRRAATPKGSAEASYERFLCVAFPYHQMRILPYNRAVRDLNGLDREEFLRRVAARFNVTRSAVRITPERRGVFGLYLPGQWYRLEIDPARIPAADPTARLDISLLAEHLLGPVLAIGDPRTDPRIEFIGGIRGPEELERRVAGGMAAAFSMYPTGMQDLMAVADAGRIMPPKSTWFEPKLADGLVSLVLD